MERSKSGIKTRSPKGLTIARANRPLWSVRTMQWKNYLTYPYNGPTTACGNNINKHNVVVFYKKWKKYNEIQLTKNKMDMNNRKIMQAQLSSGLRR